MSVRRRPAVAAAARLLGSAAACRRTAPGSSPGRASGRCARHPEPPDAAPLAENADLQPVQRPADPVRAHPVPAGRRAEARMLQAAERHAADGDARPDPAVPSVEDWPDLQVVLAGAEAGLELRQAAVLDHQVAGTGIAAAPGDDSPQAVPGRRPDVLSGRAGRGDSAAASGVDRECASIRRAGTNLGEAFPPAADSDAERFRTSKRAMRLPPCRPRAFFRGRPLRQPTDIPVPGTGRFRIIGLLRRVMRIIDNGCGRSHQLFTGAQPDCRLPNR